MRLPLTTADSGVFMTSADGGWGYVATHLRPGTGPPEVPREIRSARALDCRGWASAPGEAATPASSVGRVVTDDGRGMAQPEPTAGYRSDRAAATGRGPATVEPPSADPARR